jgi:hypothetical protein
MFRKGIPHSVPMELLGIGPLVEQYTRTVLALSSAPSNAFKCAYREVFSKIAQATKHGEKELCRQLLLPEEGNALLHGLPGISIVGHRHITDCSSNPPLRLMLNDQWFLRFFHGNTLYIYCQCCVHPIMGARYNISWHSGTTYVTLWCTAGTPETTFEVSMPMSNTSTYLGFIQELTALRESRGAWHDVHERLTKKGSHVPEDFEMYMIPLGIIQPIANLYMALCNTRDCDVEMDNIVPRLRGVAMDNACRWQRS